MKTDRSTPSDSTRLIVIELWAVKNGSRKLLVKQPTKVNNMLGIFHENDAEAERDLSMAVEGMIMQVMSQLAIIGAVTAVNNAFYEC